MRLAVLANIHGNMYALEAALAEIEARAQPVDRVVCAGDIVGLGPQPNEVIELLRSRDIESIRGNYDDAVTGRRGTGVDYPDHAAELVDRQAIAWTRASLKEPNLEYLQQLPRDLRLMPGPAGVRVKRDADDAATAEYRSNFFVRSMFGGLLQRRARPVKRVRVVHGSPRAANEFIWPDSAQSILSTIARDADADMLISAHAAVGFHREQGALHFVGVGAIGGRRTLGRAEYAVVNVGQEIEVEFGDVEYDAVMHVRAIEDTGLPAALAVQEEVHLA